MTSLQDFSILALGYSSLVVLIIGSQQQTFTELGFSTAAKVISYGFVVIPVRCRET